MANRITPLLLAVWAFATLHATAQEPIVLRDLSVLQNQQIAGFDHASVQLSTGRELGWDEILSATVAADQQATFDQNIAQIGLPLFRLKYRVSLGDWIGAGELAEPLYRSLVWNGLTADGDPKSNYIICVATMKSRLQTGQRAGAVVPFLRAAKIQQAGSDGAPDFQLLPTADAESLVSAEILPIWFDQEDAEIAFDQLANSFVPTSATQDVGAIVYLTAVAIKVKRFSLAKELLLLIESKGEGWTDWRTVLIAELEIEQGNPSAATQTIDQAQESLQDAPAIVGAYLRNAMLFFEFNRDAATSKQNITEKIASDGMLELLQISAFQDQRFPVLAAAALYQSAAIAENQGWQTESGILRRELKYRYPSSYHANLLKE